MTPHPPLTVRPDPHPLTPDCVRGLAEFIAARQNAARQIKAQAARLNPPQEAQP